MAHIHLDIKEKTKKTIQAMADREKKTMKDFVLGKVGVQDGD